MRKEEVQQRVLKDGKQLDLNLFAWDENTNTFSSKIGGLVIDFNGIENCTFKTGSYCTFKTGSYCTFDTGSYCTFDTYHNCTFDTYHNCTFDTGSECTFDTVSDCTFTTGKNSVIVRRGIFEVIQPEENETIKLNGFNIKGYTVVEDKKTITIDDKDIEISIESFNELKKQLLG